MKSIVNDDFLLDNIYSKILYKKFACDMPIFDFHCHLNVRDIYEDKVYEDICKLWLVDGKYGDHYKWRLMRANGISEDYITGNRSNKEKFNEWVKTLNVSIMNPVYDWSYMELYKFFGVKEVINEDEYDNLNYHLSKMSVRSIINKCKVKYIYTTDDPIDDLKYHILLEKDKSFACKVKPSFRPDNIINIDNVYFNEYINKFKDVCKCDINCLDDLLVCVEKRLKYFKEVGCKIADHALDDYYFVEGNREEVDSIFKKKLMNNDLEFYEVQKYKTFIILYLMKLYKENNIVCQFHIASIRNVNSKMYEHLGKDIGNDAISDYSFGNTLHLLLDKSEKNGNLYKTIVYSLNSNYYDIISTIINCFNKEAKGFMQVGSAWWFNDHIDGMLKQISSVCNTSLICNFIGMLTDSRSFLSFVRHDYFRRILCNFLGENILKGRIVNDLELIGKIIKDISYYNAYRYFYEN